MTDFQREERYIVVKRKDMTAHQEAMLRNFLSGAQIPTRESVVVEPKWPFYEHVWSLIEDHVNKGKS